VDNVSEEKGRLPRFHPSARKVAVGVSWSSTEVSGMGDEDQIGLSTGEAAQAAGNAATASEQYERIDLDFRAAITGVSDAVVEPPVVTGVSMFCEQRVYDLVRLRAHMQDLGASAGAGGQAAAETDRGNAERFAPWAV